MQTKATQLYLQTQKFVAMWYFWSYFYVQQAETTFDNDKMNAAALKPTCTTETFYF